MKQISIYLLLIIGFSACKIQAATEKKYQKSKVIISASNLKLIMSLNEQILKTKSYDPAYKELSYPNGDVALETGVCADVVVRALRSIHVDLQKEIHEDMLLAFAAYPKQWDLKKPDKNIDHRRVLNIMKFLERKNKELPITALADEYLPGDIVAWKLPNNLYHIGMVSDELNENGIPIIIHNIGSGTLKADVLFNWKIIGHYRWNNETDY